MYFCVHCQTPSPTLYHTLHNSTRSSTSSSTATSNNNKSPISNVKLTRCSYCHLDVDHYIEHESLLILMDLILLRIPAYRHFYFHREPYASFCIHDSNKHCETPTERNSSSNSSGSCKDGSVPNKKEEHEEQNDDNESSNPQKALVGFFVAAFLDAYHKLESIQISSSSSLIIPSSAFLLLIIMSSFEHVLFISGIWGYVRYQTISIHSNTALVSKLYLAVIIPTYIRFFSIWILIWENSDTIRILSSFFVLLYQLTSLITILHHYHLPNKPQQQLHQHHETQSPPMEEEQWKNSIIPSINSILCGIGLRSGMMFGAYAVLSPYFSFPMVNPCSGYEMDLTSILPPTILDHSHWPTTLCIT